jgi:hypothetical protein
MYRHGCPVDDFCTQICDTAREVAPAIHRHPWDKVPADGLGLRESKRKGLGGNHVHYR